MCLERQHCELVERPSKPLLFHRKQTYSNIPKFRQHIFGDVLEEVYLD